MTNRADLLQPAAVLASTMISSWAKEYQNNPEVVAKHFWDMVAALERAEPVTTRGASVAPLKI